MGIPVSGGLHAAPANSLYRLKIGNADDTAPTVVADSPRCAGWLSDMPQGAWPMRRMIYIYLLQLGCHPVAVDILHVKNMKLVTARFKSGGLHEKHVVATWNDGNRLSVCL